MDRETLFKLKPYEFERLCAEILKAEGFESVEVVGGPSDQGVDVIASSKGRRVVIQVKHTRHLSRKGLENIVDKLRANQYEADEFIVITSANLTENNKALVQELSSKGIHLQLLGQDDVLAYLRDNPTIRQTYVSTARNRSFYQRISLWLSLAGAFFSIFSFLVMAIIGGRLQPPLNQRIQTVEKAIGSLKDLEQYLTDIKGDMVETEQAVNVIEEEYAKAKELEKLTEVQFESVKSALRNKSWRQTILNYVLGFVLGIASSLTASVIYSRWKQRRALLKE